LFKVHNIESELMFEKGQQIGRYQILGGIGAGGMGEVYLAQDSQLDRQVALKILPTEFAQNAVKMRRFVQEAKATSALNHPNIITIHEIGEFNNTHFIITEYIQGKNLRDVLNAKAFSLEEVLEITIQIASALQAAHQAGIIHRDIKPENVMIRDDGYVKVLDFGLAKFLEPSPATNLSANPDDVTIVNLQTQAGIVLGTAAYMSPEQSQGKEVDLRTDIFSLGVVLYELLTRRQPFRGETINHIIVAILEAEPPSPSFWGIKIPEELETIIFHALAKNPDERYQSISDLLNDLKRVQKRQEFETEVQRSMPEKQTSLVPTRLYSANSSGGGQMETLNTIAVLPFLNLSHHKDSDYFSDGLAEELLNVLSKIRGFRVAARTSAFSFKGKQTTVAEIGRVLNVSSVLEGSLRMAGNRVRISVQLVNVADGYHLWSETYDRTMDDIFEVQDDIAQSVVKELRTRLLGEKKEANASAEVHSEVAKAALGRADDPEAQRLMLLGRYFLDRTTREDTAKAIQYFREALNLDPGFALCWAELGRAYSIEAGRVWVPVKEGFDRSRDAVRRALSFEPELAEGHAQLGRIQAVHDWDLRGAEQSYQRAMELAPGSSSVLDGASVLAYKLGRLEDALALARRVLVQDPLSAAFWHNLGLVSHAAGDLSKSENALRRALELSPQRFVSSALLALVLLDQGKVEEALEQAQREPYEMWRLWAQAIIYHSAARDAESDEVLQMLIEEHSEGNAYQIAEVYAMCGNTDTAFEWLERAFDERDSGLTHAKANPRFRTLQKDARWEHLLKRIGFDD
jgi:eukaryotic-like serine/threonine-protein kinase